MAEIFVHIYLEKEGQICINNVHYFTLSERQKIKLKMNFQDYFLIEYKPINNLQYASFLSKIILKQNSLESESPNIYIVELSANNFYILIIPFRLDIKSKIFSQNNEINKQGKKITFNGEKVENKL